MRTARRSLERQLMVRQKQQSFNNLRGLVLRIILPLITVVAPLFPGAVALAQATLVYSFEFDTEGFAPNGFPGTPTITQDTVGATEGMMSMHVTVPPEGTFVGALSTSLLPEIGDPPGIDHVLFDLTITEPFGPQPPPDPAPFAVVGISMFGHGAGQFGLQTQFADTEPIDGKEPGTYRDIRIDLDQSVGPYRAGESFNEIFCTGGECPENDLTPSGFQFFFNKTAGHALSAYIDNVRVVAAAPGVPGDYNDNGTVDAADYVVWRKHLNSTDELPNDNGLGVPIGTGHYDLWRQNFGSASSPGGSSANAAPEPGAIGLLLVAGAAWWMRRHRCAVSGMAARDSASQNGS
jgi:hypothetical protein